MATLKIQSAEIEPFWATPKIFLFLWMRFLKKILTHMVWKCQNEISPIFYYRKKLKTSENLLKIPVIQPPDWKHPYWMTLYKEDEDRNFKWPNTYKRKIGFQRGSQNHNSYLICLFLMLLKVLTAKTCQTWYLCPRSYDMARPRQYIWRWKNLNVQKPSKGSKG